MTDPVRPGAVEARGLGRRFEVRSSASRSLKEVLLRRRLPRRRELWALRDLDLDIRPGESFGIVGENGSGKSTLLKLLAGIFAPSEGTLRIGGRVGALLEIGAGFHPEFSGIENVYLNAAIYGLDRDYVDAHLDEIIGFAELEDFADAAVKTYSSGMFMRLGFSVAVHVNPDILLLDEVLAVGDESFQHRCHGKIWEFKRAGGTIVFVSHDPTAVAQLCERAVLLEHGCAVAHGPSEDVLRTYHERLTARVPELGAGGPGEVPGQCAILDVRAIASDGALRDRFVEGDPLTLEAWLRAEGGASGAVVTMGFRETGGRPVGWQTTSVDLPAARSVPVRLQLPSLPMRDGRFSVDVWVRSADDSHELARKERALEISVFSHDSFATGPFALNGTWELPAAPNEKLVESSGR